MEERIRPMTVEDRLNAIEEMLRAEKEILISLVDNYELMLESTDDNGVALVNLQREFGEFKSGTKKAFELVWSQSRRLDNLFIEAISKSVQKKKKKATKSRKA